MKHAPSHPRFQAAARFHIVRLICLGCSETKTFFQRLSFSKDCPSSQQIFFSKTLCFYLLSFFQRLSIFSAGLFSKIFFLPIFFSKTLHLFSNLSFSQRLFSQLSVFFKASFLAKDRQSNTGRTTRKVLVGQPVLLSLSIAKVYLRVPCSLSFFKDNLFF